MSFMNFNWVKVGKLSTARHFIYLLGWGYFSYFHFMTVTVLVTFIKSLQHCFLVETIRYDNTSNLLVILSLVLLRMLMETEFLFRLSRHRFQGRSLLLFCLETEAEMRLELFRVSGKAESNQLDPQTTNPAPLGEEPFVTPELLHWKPVWRGALQALRDLHTNPLCDNTRISGLQTWGWWVCYKCLDR